MSHTEPNQIFGYFQKGVLIVLYCFFAQPKKQPKVLNNEHFITNITQGNQLNQSGHPCSKVFTKYVGVLFGKTKKTISSLSNFNTLVMIKFVGNYVWLITF